MHITPTVKIPDQSEIGRPRTMRVGYPDTGFAFYLTRCPDEESLARRVTKLGFGKSFDHDNPPVGMCLTVTTQGLSGILLEAVGGLLNEIHMVVRVVTPGEGVKDDNGDIVKTLTPAAARRMELRHWRHEIGHAVACACEKLPGVLGSSFPYSTTWTRSQLEALQEEFPAMTTELLCEAVDILISGEERPPESGFGAIFKGGI